VKTTAVVPVDLRGESPGTIDAERFHLKLLCRGSVAVCSGPDFPGCWTLARAARRSNAIGSG
jgi:hypothetical protein